MTSKDYLSQEEIDALLRQSLGEDGDDVPAAAPETVSVNDILTPIEQDALGEIGNITFGSAATALSTLLGKKVEITTPQVSVIQRDKFIDEFPKPHVAVHVKFVEGFEGINSLVIKTHDAKVIADLMLGGEGIVAEDTELNDIHISAVQEAMNQMMGSSATSMSTIFNRLVNISPPDVDILDMQTGIGVQNIPPDDIFVKIQFRLTIGDLIDSTIMQLLTVPFAKELVRSLMGETQAQTATPPQSPASAPAGEPSAASAAPQQPSPPPAAPADQGMPMPGYGVPTPGYGAPMPGYGAPMPGYGAPAPGFGASMPGYGAPSSPQTIGATAPRGVPVNPVQFSSLGDSSITGAEETNLNLLLDIPLKVTVELGRTQKQIKEILELSQGSIIELDKLAGEPVDILVNNKLIARGEVVVIDENFGVRVTDIVSQWDRVQKIK